MLLRGVPRDHSHDDVVAFCESHILVGEVVVGLGEHRGDCRSERARAAFFPMPSDRPNQTTSPFNTSRKFSRFFGKASVGYSDLSGLSELMISELPDSSIRFTGPPSWSW